ncbi:MAG: sodium/glutamate symporter [Mesorhizobium sp.]|nr:sodium/glutamate symporter [Mesorhizobium sp.]MBL8575813.1 sodium/glutamate symporter [Mesorhizobium sp.]
MTNLTVPALLTFTISIVVFFVGAGINNLIPQLKRWNIPQAVTGGLLAAVVTLLAYRLFDVSISFELGARDMLLLYFFTGIGLNARLTDLLAGGRTLAILLGVTLVYLVIQNLIALGSVRLLNLPEGLAVFLGSASLMGGHGTTIAWAPVVAERFNLDNALEVGMAVATLGLVLASLVGGPIAGRLIARYKLSGPVEEAPVIGLPDETKTEGDDLNHVSLLRTILVLNVAILIGLGVWELVDEFGIRMPSFVVCLLVAIVLTNTIPRLLPRLQWPTRSRSLSLLSDLSLNIFLSMSLMSMQLWTLGGLGPALVLVLAVQTLATIVYIVFVVFPAMGRTYNAAVISAGFTGVTLGATPTAIANMTAVTKTHGAAPIAFIILPLVSAFFLDLANVVAISWMIR